MFHLVKLKVAFTNTIYWCRIWLLIHANPFYNLELTEFKAYNIPKCISIPFNNLRRFFQKISITWNLEQKCWDKIEDLFFIEKNPLPPNQCCLQSFRVLAIKLDQIQHWYRGVRIWELRKCGNLEFEKFSPFLNLLDFRLLSQQVLFRVVIRDESIVLVGT